MEPQIKHNTGVTCISIKMDLLGVNSNKKKKKKYTGWSRKNTIGDNRFFSCQ